MQDDAAASVLHSEATMPATETDTPDDVCVTSDEQLMKALSCASMNAFGELFSRYKQPLFGFFRRRVVDPAQAEELTQETFLAVLRASSRYESRALFRT